MEKTKVLIVGGTGYLGQHLLQTFAGNNGGDRYDVAFTHHSSPLPRRLLDAFPQFPAFPVSGLGLNSISQDFGQPDVVVNCAAPSVPRACEQDPDSAMSINVPTSLVNWLTTFDRNKTLLIHLSTDQDDKQMQLVLNAGGPERLSRVQMAQVVVEVRGHNLSLIKHVSASSVDRGVVSPTDISMDITKLIQQTLELSPTSFKDGVRLTL